MDGEMERCMERWMDDGWMDRWMEVRKQGRWDHWMARS